MSKPIDNIDLSQYEVSTGGCVGCAMYTQGCGPEVFPANFGCTLGIREIYKKRRPKAPPTSCKVIMPEAKPEYILADDIPNRTYFIGRLVGKDGSVDETVSGPQLYAIWGDSIVPIDSAVTAGAPSKFGEKVFNYKPVAVRISVTKIIA